LFNISSNCDSVSVSNAASRRECADPVLLISSELNGHHSIAKYTPVFTLLDLEYGFARRGILAHESNTCSTHGFEAHR
jgi:hypothetical protein